MKHLLYSPQGRIGPQDFLKGFGLILLLHALITMVAAFNIGISAFLVFFSVVLFYPLFCLLIKRSRDGGKSGWMSIVWFILLLVFWFMLSGLAQNLTGGELLSEMTLLTQDAMAAGDWDAIVEISNTYFEPLAKKTSVPKGIARFFGLMIAAVLLNKIIGEDLHDNVFGPKT